MLHTFLEKMLNNKQPNNENYNTDGTAHAPMRDRVWYHLSSHEPEARVGFL